DTLHQVRGVDPVPPRRLNPKVPRDLETVCLKCLRKEPHRRYASAQELADDLGRFLGDEPVRASPPGPVYRFRKFARRNRRALPLAGLVAVATLLGGVGLAREWRRGAAVERAVAEDLREAERHQQEARWPEAVRALERAEGRLAAGGPARLRAR